jgi:succinate dehydrogenase hydrophobic anchor subunit
MPTPELLQFLKLVGEVGGPAVLLVVSVLWLVLRFMPSRLDRSPEAALTQALNDLRSTVAAQGTLIAAQTQEMNDLRLRLADTLARHDVRLDALERAK